MKFWVNAKVQCEAQEVLAIPCEEEQTVRLLCRARHMGKVDPLSLYSSQIGVIDLEHSQWEGEGWAAHSQDRKPPRFFCPAHAEAGVERLKQVGDK